MWSRSCSIGWWSRRTDARRAAFPPDALGLSQMQERSVPRELSSIQLGGMLIAFVLPVILGLPAPASGQYELRWRMSEQTAEEIQLSSIWLGGFTPDGLVFLADALRNDIVVLTSEGTMGYTIGRPGSGPGEFERISWVIARQGRLEALDGRLGLLHRFEWDGRLIESVRPPSSDGFMIAATEFSDGGWFVASPQRMSFREGLRPSELSAAASRDDRPEMFDSLSGGGVFWESPDGRSFGGAPIDLGMGGGYVVAGDSLIVANGFSGEINIYLPGSRPGELNRTATLTVPVRNRPMEANLIESVEAIVGELMLTNARLPRDPDLTLPPGLSDITEVLLDRPAGHLWLRRGVVLPEIAESTAWTVLDLADGSTTQVDAPKGGRLLAVNRGVLLISHLGAFDIPAVSLWEMR